MLHRFQQRDTRPKDEPIALEKDLVPDATQWLERELLDEHGSKPGFGHFELMRREIVIYF